MIEELASSLTDGSHDAASAEYRLHLFDVMTDSSNLSLLGNATDGLPASTRATAQSVGLESLDSQFAVVYFLNGVIALALFVGVVVAVVLVPIRQSLSPAERAWASATGATALGLTAVALLTQHTAIFWIGVGLTSALWGRRGSDEPGSGSVLDT